MRISTFFQSSQNDRSSKLLVPFIGLPTQDVQPKFGVPPTPLGGAMADPNFSPPKMAKILKLAYQSGLGSDKKAINTHLVGPHEVYPAPQIFLGFTSKIASYGKNCGFFLVSLRGCRENCSGRIFDLRPFLWRFWMELSFERIKKCRIFFVAEIIRLKVGQFSGLSFINAKVLKMPQTEFSIKNSYQN